MYYIYRYRHDIDVDVYIYILSHIYQARRRRGPVCGAPRRSARGQLTRISRAPPFRTPCVPPFRCAPYVPSLCPPFGSRAAFVCSPLSAPLCVGRPMPPLYSRFVSGFVPLSYPFPTPPSCPPDNGLNVFYISTST